MSAALGEWGGARGAGARHGGWRGEGGLGAEEEEVEAEVLPQWLGSRWCGTARQAAMVGLCRNDKRVRTVEQRGAERPQRGGTRLLQCPSGVEQ